MSKKDKGKSILDDVPAKGMKFPLDQHTSSPVLGIVGHCCVCGAPIYGHSITILENPIIRYSCSCHFKSKTLSETMETK